VAKVVLLESVYKYPVFDVLVSMKLKEALKYFPELEGETVYVGVRRKTCLGDVRGAADPENNIVFFNPRDPPSYVTVFHELMHLAVAKLRREGRKVPRTEAYVSIAAVARMPSHLVDENRIPYVVDEVPEHLAPKLPKLCHQALEHRKHRRNYIQYLKKLIEEEKKKVSQHE